MAGIGFSVDPVSAFASVLNYRSQKQALAYQKKLNAIQMQREDSAYQRAVADARKAGLSPLAVSGTSGASAGSLNAGSAPMLEPGNALSVAADPLEYRLAREQQDNNNVVAQSTADKNRADAFSAQQDAQRKIVENRYTEQDMQSRIAERLANTQKIVAEYENLLKDKDLKEDQRKKYMAEIDVLKQQVEKYKQDINESKRREQNLAAEYDTIQLNNFKKQLENDAFVRDLTAAAQSGLSPDEFFKQNSNHFGILMSAYRGSARYLQQRLDVLKSAVNASFDRMKAKSNAKKQQAVEAQREAYIKALEDAYYAETKNDYPIDYQLDGRP